MKPFTIDRDRITLEPPPDEDNEATKASKSPQAQARALVKARLDEAKRLAETVIKPGRQKHYTGTIHDAHQEVHGGKTRPISKPSAELLNSIYYTSDDSEIDNIIPNGKMTMAEFVHNAYNFTDDQTGLRAEVDGFEFSRGSSIVYGKIYDKNGDRVGNYERTIHENGTIEQTIFKLDSNIQANGFGSRFYQNQENVYVEAGFDEVKLHANKDVGGYAWARMGYDWDRNAEGLEEDGYYDEDDDFIAYDGYEAAKQTTSHFVNLYTQTYGSPPLYTPKHAWEIAAYKGPDGRPIGKESLLNSNWYAVKSLSQDSEGYKIGQEYYESK